MLLTPTGTVPLSTAAWRLSVAATVTHISFKYLFFVHISANSLVVIILQTIICFFKGNIWPRARLEGASF